MDEESPNTMAPPQAQPAAPKRQPLPDFADIIYIMIVALLVLELPNYVLNDGSTGWHVYTGQYILSHGRIPHTDIISYTFPNKPWVPYEWLFDVIAGGLVQLGGLKLLAVAADCALALLFSFVYYACRKEGCHFLLAMLLTVIGILTSSIHWLARPHLFTYFGVLIFFQTLESFRRGQINEKRLLLTIGLTMIVWANTHPAFLVGFGIIGIYLVCELFLALMAGEPLVLSEAWKRVRGIALSFFVAIIGSFINANGVQLYTYIFQYLHYGDVIAQTQEFMPPDWHKLFAVCMALLFFAFVVGLFLSKKKPGLSPLMIVLAFAWLGINSMRNDPLFVIVAVPVIASLYADCDLSLLTGSAPPVTAAWFNKLAGRWDSVGATVDEVESSCTMHIIPGVVTLILVVSCFFGGKLFGADIVTADIDPTKQPTTTLDAMMKLPEKGGFNLDNWGGLIIFKTGRRVFIDDRLDFYGQDFMINYGHVLGISGNWKDVLSNNKINWILMPSGATLIQVLKATPDWEVRATDKAATLLVRKTPL